MSKYDISNFMPTLRYHAMRSRYVLEIGVKQDDGSTAAFLDGLRVAWNRNKLLVSVDWNPEEFIYADESTRAPWHKFVAGDSRSPSTVDEVLKVSDDLTPDLIFIDTDHYYEHMKAELEVWPRIAGKNTVWLFHDTYMHGQYNHMTDAIKEFAAANGWVYEDLSTDPHGLGRMTHT